jgi:hypothetical protein
MRRGSETAKLLGRGAQSPVPQFLNFMGRSAMWRDYHLAQADRHIAEAKQRIARQRDLIAMLESTNHPSEPAVSMLAAMKKSLQAFEHHRRLLQERYAMPRGPQRQKRAATAVNIRAAE